MATFLVRVELHGAHDWRDYDVLHKAMETAGFSRTVTSDKNITYHLPTAEYEMEGTYTRKEVLAKTKAAAAKTGKSYGAIVTESNGQTWTGLKEVE